MYNPIYLHKNIKQRNNVTKKKTEGQLRQISGQ